MAGRLPINPEVSSARLKSDRGIPELGQVAPTRTGGTVGMFNNYQDIQTGIQINSARMQRNRERMYEAKKVLSDEYSALSRTYASNALININAEQMAASENFLANNPSADGYAKFMAQSYQESISRETSNAPDRMTANLITAQAKVTMLDGIEAASKRERTIKTDYVLSRTEQNRQVLLQQVVNNPYNAAALKLQYESSLLAVRDFIPEKFASYQRGAMEEFSTAAITGLIESNPGEALKKLKNDVIPDLSVQSKLHLMHYAENKVKEIEAKANAVQAQIERASAHEQEINYLNLKNLIASGGCSEAIIDEADVSEIKKLKLKRELIKYNGEETKKEATKDQYKEKIYKEEPIIGVRDSVAEAVYLDFVKIESEKNRAAGLSPKLSSLKKAEIVLGFNSDNTFPSLCSDLRTDITRGTAEEAFNAALAIELINQSNPDAIKELDSRDFAYASYMKNNAVMQGSDTYRLNALHTKALDMFYSTPTKQMIEERTEKYKKFIKTTPNKDYIRSIANKVSDVSWLGGVFGTEHDKYWDPVNDARLRLDAKKIAREKFMSGMDSESDVKEATQDDLNRIWGISKINGKDHFMKYPPEKSYPQLSIAELRHQVSDKIQNIAALHQKKLGKDTQIRPGKSNTNTIQAFIDDKWVEVPVLVDSVNEKAYSLYYLENANNLLTRRNITNPNNGLVISFKFGPPKEKERKNNATS